MRKTLLIIAATLLAVNAGARPLAVEDYYRIVGVQAPAMSPDGRWVAFIRSAIVEAENRRQGELWIVPADGSAPARRVSDPAMNASGPRWSPDGALLAFSGRRRGAPASDDAGGSIWFLRADRLDDAPMQIRGVEGTPIFSPDNKWIAFTKRVAKPKAPQYANDADRLINERFKGKAYEWLNYRFDQRGYLPDPRDPDATPPGGVVRRPARGWRGEAIDADDGQRERRRVAARQRCSRLRRQRVPARRVHYARADLWTVTIDGTVKRLTNDGYDHNSPAWSPDGKSLVARRELGLSAVIASKQMHGAPTDVALFAADGGAPKNLTADWDLLPGPPAYQPGRPVRLFRGGHRRQRSPVPGRGQFVARRAGHDGRTSPRQLHAVRAVGRHGLYRRGQRASRGALRVRHRRPRREEADRFQRRIREGHRSGHRGPDSLPEQGWHADRRVGAETARLRSGARLAADSGHARRTARRLRQRLLVRVPAVRRERLPGGLHEPARLDQLRREIPVGDVGRLGQPRLRGRHGRRRLREDEDTPSTSGGWASPATRTAASSPTG